MNPLYCVAILDFPFFEKDKTCFNHISLIREETKEKVTDKINIILIELSKFDKSLKELSTPFDQWMYCFKHLKTMDTRPVELAGRTFETLFETAEKNNLTLEEMATYKKSVLEYDDVRSAMLFNHDAGLKKGREEGRKEIMSQVIQAMNRGMSIEELAELIGCNAK